MITYTQYKYNPLEAPPEDLKAIFVGHHHLLDRLLEAVREQTRSDSIQNYLLLGPRGIGKTTLLLMLQRRIKTDPELCVSWFPVLYREEEFYIYTFRDLMALALEYLYEEESIPEAGDLLSEADAEKDDDASLARILDCLKKICQTRGKRILLLIDNFDQVFPKHAGSEKNQQAFRKLLSTESFIMVVGTSTLLFEHVFSYDEAFYNFFSPVNIEYLDDTEIRQLLQNCARLDQNHAFLRDYEKQKVKVKAITSLTGGNPRLILMLYDILSRRQVLPVVEALRETIDSLTPLYKHVLDDLPRQQSKILDAIIRLGGAASPSRISEQARLPLNKVTAQLGRLKAARMVDVQGEGRGKPAVWHVCDRMFRTWYQIRYLSPARRRVEMFVEFLRAWFSVEERMEQFNDYSALIEMEDATRDILAKALISRGTARLKTGDAGSPIILQSTNLLVNLLCILGRKEEAIGWVIRMDEFKIDKALRDRHLEARIELILTLAQGHSIDLAETFLDEMLESAVPDLRDRLRFLKPGLAFARSRDEAIPAGLPEEEKIMVKRTAERILRLRSGLRPKTGTRKTRPSPRKTSA